MDLYRLFQLWIHRLKLFLSIAWFWFWDCFRPGSTTYQKWQNRTWCPGHEQSTLLKPSVMEVQSGQTVGSDNFDAYVMLHIICAYNLCENEKIIGNFNRIDNKYSHFFYWNAYITIVNWYNLRYFLFMKFYKKISSKKSLFRAMYISFRII